MREAFEQLASGPGGLAFAIVLGLLWGSFANVCVYRWPPTDEHPHGRSVVAPGSHCSVCKTPIRWYDNVPILSYLWLRGRCRSCGTSFSPRYLLVEAVTGALFGVAWWFTFGTGGMFVPADAKLVQLVIDMAFVFVMVVITFIDLDHKLILNKVTIPAIVLAYGASLVVGHRWWDGLIGAAVGYGVPWLIGELYYRIRKQEGLGLGDGMLLAVVGALFGWRGVFVSLLGGSVLGSVIGIAALVAARRGGAPVDQGAPAAEGAAPADAAPPAEAAAPGDEPPSLMRTELPFGPFLAAAAVFYLFAEPWISLHFRLTAG